MGFPRTHDYPVCLERREISMFLLAAAMDFIFFHEFSHIFNGHVGKDLALGRLYRREITQEDDSSQDLEESQSCEYDADMFAIDMALNYCLNDDRIDNFLEIQSTGNLAGIPKILLRAYLGIYAISCVWHVIQPYDPIEDFGDKDRSHPPISVRKYSTNEQAINFLSFHNLGPPEELGKVFSSIPHEIDLLICYISGDPKPSSFPIPTNEIIEYKNWLDSQRNLHRPAWEKYAKGKLKILPIERKPT